MSTSIKGEGERSDGNYEPEPGVPEVKGYRGWGGTFFCGLGRIILVELNSSSILTDGVHDVSPGLVVSSSESGLISNEREGSV